MIAWSALPWGRIVATVAMLLLAWRAVSWGVETIREGGREEARAAAAVEIAQLQGQLATEPTQVATCAASLVRVNEEAARGIREAEARMRRGEIAAAEAQAGARDDAAEGARASGALTAARAEPTCREQLEMTLCPSIPLL